MTEPALPAPEDVSKDDRTMALLAHVLGIPLGFIGPLIIWLIKKDESAYIADQAKEALNFQITVFIAAFIAGLSTFAFIGCVLLPAVLVTNIVLCIIATMAASEGKPYRYPVTLRLVT